MWEFTGKQRPKFALEPKEGQESVWDYPRPPALSPCGERVEVALSGVTLASSLRTLRAWRPHTPPPTIFLKMT